MTDNNKRMEVTLGNPEKADGTAAKLTALGKEKHSYSFFGRLPSTPAQMALHKQVGALIRDVWNILTGKKMADQVLIPVSNKQPAASQPTKK